MSLAVAAIKIAAVRSLKGRTSVGDAVFDSAVEPFDGLRNEGAPVVVISCDTGKRDVEGRELFGARQVIELSVDMFVARAVTVDVGEIEIQIPASDEGNELYLRSLAYEVEKVLLADPSPWPELFRRLWFRASAHDLCEWDRGAIADKGRRQALLRAIYRIEPVADPLPGAEPEGVWADVLAAMEVDFELADIARYWRQLIAGSIVPDWRQAQVALGLTAAGIGGIGLTPEQ
ncbi:hypothetical protein ACQR1K_10025 [Bradyrhizobium sp. HKCCYLRH3095]|uniref:hypothetical protein n=1 Tax=Bradyrhizobium sp. HKCCYLRH3095 TaxID=3420765 RepID=UPI003EB6F77A